LQSACTNKVPQVKQETVIFLGRAIQQSTSATKRKAVVNNVKNFANLLMDLMDDSTSSVRDAAYIAFGNLVALLGERQLQGYLNKLDKIKLAKVKEVYGGKNSKRNNGKKYESNTI
jgi:cytoskeleton-associated protein 5